MSGLQKCFILSEESSCNHVSAVRIVGFVLFTGFGLQQENYRISPALILYLDYGHCILHFDLWANTISWSILVSKTCDLHLKVSTSFFRIFAQPYFPLLLFLGTKKSIWNTSMFMCKCLNTESLFAVFQVNKLRSLDPESQSDEIIPQQLSHWWKMEICTEAISSLLGKLKGEE